MRASHGQLDAAFWALRIGLGAGLLVTGLDKFAGLLANWSMYLSPLAERLIPVGGEAFLRGVGLAEAILGLAILTRWTRLAAYAMSAWVLAVAVNLALAGTFWDLVVRDTEIALSAFALGRIAGWREAAIASLAPGGAQGSAWRGERAGIEGAGQAPGP